LLFNPSPKTRRGELYNRDEELAEVAQALNMGERLVIILGVRRVEGQASLGLR